jgi:hypothetical protein
MRAAGMSSEAILLSLEALFPHVQCVVADDVTERRREADRVRKAVKRGMSADFRGIPQTSADPSPLVPPLSPAPLSPPIIPPSTKHSRAKPATELPEDWQPDAKTWALADELGFTSQQAWDQLERMRDWARNAGAKGRKPDWNAAFRNWLKRTADDTRNRPQAPQNRNCNATSFAILDAVFDEAIRRSDGRGEEGGEENAFVVPGLRKSAA